MPRAVRADRLRRHQERSGDGGTAAGPRRGCEGADNSGATPLHLAADRGYGQLVDLLLEKGADVNARDKTGAMPLNEAADKGHREVVALTAGQRRRPQPATATA